MIDFTLEELKKLRYIVDTTPVLPDSELEAIREKVRSLISKAILENLKTIKMTPEERRHFYGSPI